MLCKRTCLLFQSWVGDTTRLPSSSSSSQGRESPLHNDFDLFSRPDPEH
jgi:hypothetical protein